MMHIAVALHDPDGSYAKNLGACLCSLFANSSSPMTVHLLHTRTLTFESQNKFLALGNKFGREINFIDVEDSLAQLRLAQHPCLSFFSPATISRLFLPQILPEVSKVIYLDADMIVDIDIGELWNTELQGYPLGAVPDLGIQRARYVVPHDETCDGWANDALAKWQELGLNLDVYFNAGMLLLDLDLIRQHQLFEQALHFLENNANLPCPDQDALNAVFYDKYIPLPFKFNVMISLYPTWNAGPCIWHFTGLKPWENLHSPRKDRYDLYLEHTPWGTPQKQSPVCAPVAYICFNRPAVVREALGALLSNDDIENCNIHFFVDFPRNDEESSRVDEVISICNSDVIHENFASVTFHIQQSNLGVSKSLRTAVKVMSSLYDRFVFVEEEVLLSRFSIKYFNLALEKYRDEPSVFCISGWRPPAMTIPNAYPWDAYFSPRAFTYGWATWSSRVENVDWTASSVWEFERHSFLIEKFNKGGPDASALLSSTVHAPEQGWDIVMEFDKFKHNGLCLVPVHPYASNVGADSSTPAAALNSSLITHSSPEHPRLPDFIIMDDNLVALQHDALVVLANMPQEMATHGMLLSDRNPAVKRAKNVMDAVFCHVARDVYDHTDICHQIASWMQDDESHDCYLHELTVKIIEPIVGKTAATSLYPVFSQQQWDAAVAETVKRTDLPLIYFPEDERPYVFYTLTFTLQSYTYKDCVDVVPGDVVLDCGACYMDTALWAKAKGAGKVYSFEPNPEILPFAQKTLELHDPTGEVLHLVPLAASDACAVVKLQLQGQGSCIGEEGDVEVQTTTIDAFCSANSIIPNFIKMDIEGSELAALHGAAETIRRHKPKLAISMYHKTEDMWTIPAFIKELCPCYVFYFRKVNTAWDSILYAIHSQD